MPIDSLSVSGLTRDKCEVRIRTVVSESVERMTFDAGCSAGYTHTKLVIQNGQIDFFSVNNVWKGKCIPFIRKEETKQLIWRGSAQDTLSGKAANNEKKLDKGVAKMFKKFPPESAKG